MRNLVLELGHSSFCYCCAETRLVIKLNVEYDVGDLFPVFCVTLAWNVDIEYMPQYAILGDTAIYYVLVELIYQRHFLVRRSPGEDLVTCRSPGQRRFVCLIGLLLECVYSLILLSRQQVGVASEVFRLLQAYQVRLMFPHCEQQVGSLLIELVISSFGSTIRVHRYESNESFLVLSFHRRGFGKYFGLLVLIPSGCEQSRFQSLRLLIPEQLERVEQALAEKITVDLVECDLNLFRDSQSQIERVRFLVPWAFLSVLLVI